MARTPDSDIQLKGILMITGRSATMTRRNAVEAARETAFRLCHTAADLAKEKVAPGQSSGYHPGPHPHRGESGSPFGPESHFRWEDTGKLADAIHVEENPRVPNGVAEAQVVVDPIDVDGRGPVAIGAYLEFGFIPILPSKIPGVRGPSGHFTRYPFLAPAIAEATRDMQEEGPRIFRNLYNTASTTGKVNIELLRVDPSVVGDEEIRNKFRKG